MRWFWAVAEGEACRWGQINVADIPMQGLIPVS